MYLLWRREKRPEGGSDSKIVELLLLVRVSMLVLTKNEIYIMRHKFISLSLYIYMLIRQRRITLAYRSMELAVHSCLFWAIADKNSWGLLLLSLCPFYCLVVVFQQLIETWAAVLVSAKLPSQTNTCTYQLFPGLFR